MALIQVNFVSKSLFRTVPVQVILPVEKRMETGEQKPFKTLYLLNGVLGNYTDWVTGTRIQRWAEERNLAVVMPSGDNSFYVDQPQTRNLYGKFIGQELVEVTRRMFPLSHKREDTFIGGLSMGGYGAIRNGLKYHETFGSIIALSSALHVLEEGEESGSLGLVEGLFGDLEEARKSDRNPRVLIEALVRSGAEKPRIFMACGSGDGLWDVNRTFWELFREKGFDVTWHTAPGAHDWDFWDTWIYEGLKWLPLEAGRQGINSGNVQLDEE